MVFFLYLKNIKAVEILLVVKFQRLSLFVRAGFCPSLFIMKSYSTTSCLYSAAYIINFTLTSENSPYSIRVKLQHNRTTDEKHKCIQSYQLHTFCVIVF